MSLNKSLNIKLVIFAFTFLCLGVAVYSGADTNISSEEAQSLQPLEYSSITTNDGNYRAFIRREEGKLGHIWLENLQTKARHQLTAKPQAFVGLTFTVDEQSITFFIRDAKADVIASFDVNFTRGLSSVVYNRLSFSPGQVIAMPMWVNEEKLAYISKAFDNSISLMHWSLSRGNHKLIRRYDGAEFKLDDTLKTKSTTL